MPGPERLSLRTIPEVLESRGIDDTYDEQQQQIQGQHDRKPMAGKPGELARSPALGLLLRVHQQVLHPQELVIGDHKVLGRDVSAFAVFDSRSSAVYLLGILLLGLALDIWMVDDLAHGHAAKDGPEEAALPPVAVGAVNEGQAQVTGEVGPLSEQGRLERQRPTEEKRRQVKVEVAPREDTGPPSVEL